MASSHGMTASVTSVSLGSALSLAKMVSVEVVALKSQLTLLLLSKVPLGWKM